MNKVDFFISHASEDKEEFVRDLAQQLLRCGASVFYDEYSLKLGDSLTQKINEGLVNANHGIIIMSNFFFEKKWTIAELHAIFNKSINENFKLFIVYHNITNEEVRSKYPLLADIFATNSNKGFEKVASELMQGADIKSELKYLYTPLQKESGVKNEEGFHISIRVGIPFKGDPRIPKVLLEAGSPDFQHSRIRLIFKWNKRLYFEIVSKTFQIIGISVDIENWKIDEPHIVIANCDTINKYIYIMVDGELVDQIEFNKLELPDNFFDTGRVIIGCSLELDYPSSFIISGSSFGKSFTIKQSKDYTDALDTLNKAIGR